MARKTETSKEFCISPSPPKENSKFTILAHYTVSTHKLYGQI